MRNLAIIPARSGSKGVRDKNIMPLNGKPMLAYTIEAAIKSECFDNIIVSTDSPQYAEIARNYGAEVPFFRSSETSSDTATTSDAVIEVIENCKKLGMEYDTLTILQPTSPLRRAEDIVKAFETMEKKGAKAVVSVCEIEHTDAVANYLPEDGSLANFLAVADNLRRQEARVKYKINGAIYISNVQYFVENPHIYREGCYGYIMNPEDSIDVDTRLDILVAEFLLREREH